MSDEISMSAIGNDVKAALIVIGDEILSGRTQDLNVSYLATWLNDCGIQLKEVRIIPDDRDEIIRTVQAIRGKYNYVFTTGGIGPTHDDITAESIAAAFDTALYSHPDAHKLLESYYGVDDFTDARKRMTMVPQGADLIENKISVAPGFKIENVFVLAGVPSIMQAMLEALKPRLRGGNKMHSETVVVAVAESQIAGAVAEIQLAYESVAIGSYPSMKKEEDGSLSYQVQLVVRGVDPDAVVRCADVLTIHCDQLGLDVLD